MKEKLQLIYQALCQVTEWQKLKMPNLQHFKLPFQPCVRQGNENDDAFFVWKHIEFWNRDSWQGVIDEVI
jgi:hypothetical protein